MKAYFLKSLAGLPLYEVVNDSGHRVAEVRGEHRARQFAVSDKMLEVCRMVVEAERQADEERNYEMFVSVLEAAEAVLALVEGEQNAN